jgi:hypothetical protein
MTSDLPGAQISRAFHHEAVAPLLARHLPGLRYAAARLGSGSDVLGLDDAQSRDHDWGCRLTLLVDDADAGVTTAIEALLARELPADFRGLPVRFPMTWDQTVTHNVEIATARAFAVGRLGADPLAPLSPADWLTMTGQAVLEVTAGPVFADSTSQLRLIREALRWYPPDVEKFVLAAAWRQLAETLQLAGRAAQRGQALQSRVLAAELCRGLLHLAFLLHRSWPPYPKWTETLFRRLPRAGELAIEPILAAGSWAECEQTFAAAAGTLLGWQRDLGLPAPDSAVAPFWERPYLGVTTAIADGLLAAVTDPAVAALPPGTGSPEQWIASTAVLTQPGLRAALAAALAGRR